jgi:hypothetical protein
MGIRTVMIICTWLLMAVESVEFVGAARKLAAALVTKKKQVCHIDS